MNKIIYFDIKTKKWSECKIELPLKITGHSSIFHKSTQKIHIIGGYKDKINIDNMLNIHWKLDVFDIITELKNEWELERIIWIGYLKNMANKHCYFQLLSKNVVQLIISWIFN